MLKLIMVHLFFISFGFKTKAEKRMKKMFEFIQNLNRIFESKHHINWYLKMFSF